LIVIPSEVEESRIVSLKVASRDPSTPLRMTRFYLAVSFVI